MASLNEIRKKIKTVESTSKITNAMKLVATAKLKKEKQLFENQEIYYKNFYDLFSFIKKNTNIKEYTDKRENGKSTIWIVLFSSMGLCGSFNINIVKELEEHIQPEDQIYLIGKKGKSLLKSKNINNEIPLELEIDDKDINYDLCYVLSKNILDKYLKDQNIKSIKLLYTNFINSLSFVPKVFPLLPLDDSNNEERLEQPKNNAIFTFEPDEDTLLQGSICDYLGTCIYGGILESKVCENASRRNAMDAATKNGDELIKNYKLEFNRKRQSDITQEITEIISGSNVGE